MALDAIFDGDLRADGRPSSTAATQLVPLPDPALGARRVDVATMYNTDRYRPLYGNKLGLPIFLNRELPPPRSDRAPSHFFKVGRTLITSENLGRNR